jgi:hypothetical protein
MNAESYSSDVEIVLDKLAYAHWWEWPDRERSAVKTFLRVRWNLGLTQAPKYKGTDDEEEFDVNAWLCGIGLSALDLEPYVEDWKSRGALSTLGHLVAFIEDNPKLARGELRNAFWTPFHAARCAELMGPWVAALMDDPTFQEHLAAWYEA